MAVPRRHAARPRANISLSAPHRAILRAREYIHDRHAGRVTLDDLAEAAAVSKHALLRAFRRELGVSPYAYVVQVRVEHAKRLLRRGVPIAAAAFRSGFADQSHLTRHFKRLMGVTPGAFVVNAA